MQFYDSLFDVDSCLALIFRVCEIGVLIFYDQLTRSRSKTGLLNATATRKLFSQNPSSLPLSPLSL